MTRIAIGLGGNVGDREAHLQAGRDGLAARGVAWRRVSALYETEPVGPVADQGPFLNQVAVGETELSPRALLEVCLAVEAASGRVRAARWGPRTLDLDILLYGDLSVQETGLTLPHPELAGRAFVLVPLAEAAPEWVVPGTGKTTTALREAVAGREGVRLWRSTDMKPPM